MIQHVLMHLGALAVQAIGKEIGKQMSGPHEKAPRFTIVDQGRLDNWQWVAIPVAQAAAFSAAYPRAADHDRFAREVVGLLHDHPEYRWHLESLGRRVAEVKAAHPGCVIFIASTD